MMKSTHSKISPSKISMKSQNFKYKMYQKVITSSHTDYSTKSDRKYSALTERSHEEKQSSVNFEQQSYSDLRRTYTTKLRISPKKQTQLSKSESVSPYLLRKTQKLTKIMKTVPVQFAEEQEKEAQLQIQAPVLEHLNQFISHCLNKKQQQVPQEQEMKSHYVKELEQLQQQVSRDREEIRNMQQECKKQKIENRKRCEQIQEQYAEAEKQIHIVNMEILKVIHEHSGKKEQIKKLKKMQNQMLNKISYYQAMANEQNKVKSQRLSNQLNKKSFFIQNSTRMQYEISLFKKLIESAKDKIERIRVGSKMQKSLHVLYDQLIKQKSLKDIKAELENSIRQKPSQPSKKQILDQFYKSLSKNVQTIKNAVVSHYEVHKFITDLQMQQELNGDTIKLSKQQLQLNEEEKKFVNEHSAETNVYRQYFKGEGEFKKIMDELDKIWAKCEASLQNSKMEIQNIKKSQAELEKKKIQIQSTDKIRQAEIQTLTTILQEKKIEIDKSKNNKGEADGYQFFRNSIANFVKKKATN